MLMNADMAIAELAFERAQSEHIVVVENTTVVVSVAPRVRQSGAVRLRLRRKRAPPGSLDFRFREEPSAGVP